MAPDARPLQAARCAQCARAQAGSRGEGAARQDRKTMTSTDKPFLDIYDDPEAPAASLSLPAGGPRAGMHAGREHPRDQECHRERTVLHGHFPERPVMPGVMILEALAQAAGILAYTTLGKVPNENTRFYFAGIDGCRFRRPVEPGDQLILTAQVLRNMKGIWKLATAAYVGEAEAVQAEMMLFADAENATPLDQI